MVRPPDGKPGSGGENAATQIAGCKSGLQSVFVEKNFNASMAHLASQNINDIREDEVASRKCGMSAHTAGLQAHSGSSS
jgi:hypothetical protein